MRKGEHTERSKMVGHWIVSIAVLLVAGILAVLLWPDPSGKAPELQTPQTSDTGALTEPSISADEAHPTAPTAETTGSVDPSTDIQVTQPTSPDVEKPTSAVTVPPEQLLVCQDIGLYSGAFVEDGSDEPVQNVAALLLTNGSDQYLDLAKLTYELDGQEAVFMVTGLPAGGSAWVLESSRMTASAESEFRHKSTVTSFRDNAVNTLDGIDLEFDGTMLKATNTTDKTYKALTVYYKVLHKDGNYLGGIAYMVSFGDLEPGQSAEKIAGHFQSDKTHIVRIGYQQ